MLALVQLLLVKKRHEVVFAEKLLRLDALKDRFSLRGLFWGVQGRKINVDIDFVMT